jgi:serine protease
MKRRLGAALLALAVNTCCGAASGPATGLIVQLNNEPGSRLQTVLDQRAPALRAGAALSGRWQRVQAPAAMNGAEAEAWAAQLRADPRIRAVLPDVREQRMDVTPNDARFTDQWWLKAVAAGNTGAGGFSTAWSRSTGLPGTGLGAVVAVLDSGVTSHPELNPRLVPGYDFVSDAVYANDGNGRDNDPSDPGDAVTAADRTGNPSAFGNCPEAPQSSWHGTVIAGQAAAVSNNTEGVAAGNWYGRVLPVRVAGKCGAAVGDIIDGMRWAAGLHVAGVPDNLNPARVIVISYGSTDPCDVNSSSPSVAQTARLYLDAIAEVRQAGSLVIVAAGNLRSAVARPASCSGAFAVASSNREGYKSVYSNFGPEIALATPGGDLPLGDTCDTQLADSGIVSTGNLGDVTPGSPGYVAASGTSFAAPAVAATATLMLAINPGLTVAQMEDGLKRSARPHVLVPLLGNCSATDNKSRCACTSATCGAGLLDTDQALAFAAAPATWTAPARSAITLSDSRLEACAALLGRTPPVDPTPPPAPTPTPAPTPAPGSGGGGASSLSWLLGLGIAVVALQGRRRPARHRRN